MAAVLILGITARLSDVVQQQCYLNSNVLARIVGNCMSDVVINGVLVVFVVLVKTDTRFHLWNDSRNHIGIIQQDGEDAVSEKQLAKFAVDSFRSNIRKPPCVIMNGLSRVLLNRKPIDRSKP